MARGHESQAGKHLSSLFSLSVGQPIGLGVAIKNPRRQARLKFGGLLGVPFAE